MISRGFVTLATGKDIYYEMAYNMLRSYRLHNQTYPVAIICDRENEYTKAFDAVVILPDVKCDYRDKFRLLVDCPYDETIFIEPDCLIYRNLDHFWDLLSGESDFTSFGWNNGSAVQWFEHAAAWEATGVTEPLETATMPLINPGYLFVRNGQVCRDIYEDMNRMAENLMPHRDTEPRLFSHGRLRDDPILCLGMKKHGCECAAKPSEGKCMSLPSGYTFRKISLQKGELEVADKNGKVFSDCALLHFSTRRVLEDGLYSNQIAVLDRIEKGRSVTWINSRFMRGMYDLGWRVKQKFKK